MALRKVARTYPEHYRSRTAGERVTLASLHARGHLVRRAWRGEAGQADAAYEYTLHPELAKALAAKMAERRAAAAAPTHAAPTGRSTA